MFPFTFETHLSPFHKNNNLNTLHFQVKRDMNTLKMNCNKMMISLYG